MRIGIVGVGKITRDQHLPALAADARFTLAGTADPQARLDGVPGHADLAAMLAAVPDIDAVCICTPPQQRFALAQAALLAGKHVLLEKPPGATLAEVDVLRALADRQGVTLFAAWHSRFAPAVRPAAAWAAGRRVTAVAITWREDVHRWHPGQDWIWRPGGFGVFDPGINALSIVTAILPPLLLSEATLHVPANRQAPVEALLQGRLNNGAAVTAALDFLAPGEPAWTIRIDAAGGESLMLSQGGAALAIDGAAVTLPASREYAAIYAHFAALIAAGRSDVDTRPLALVADAFLIGRRVSAAPFIDG